MEAQFILNGKINITEIPNPNSEIIIPVLNNPRLATEDLPAMHPAFNEMHFYKVGFSDMAVAGVHWEDRVLLFAEGPPPRHELRMCRYSAVYEPHLNYFKLSENQVASYKALPDIVLINAYNLLFDHRQNKEPLNIRISAMISIISGNRPMGFAPKENIDLCLGYLERMSV